MLTNIVATHARESEPGQQQQQPLSSDKNVAATKWLIGIAQQQSAMVAAAAVTVVVVVYIWLPAAEAERSERGKKRGRGHTVNQLVSVAKLKTQLSWGSVCRERYNAFFVHIIHIYLAQDII